MKNNKLYSGIHTLFKLPNHKIRLSQQYALENIENIENKDEDIYQYILNNIKVSNINHISKKFNTFMLLSKTKSPFESKWVLIVMLKAG